MKAETPFQRIKSITTKNGCMACLVHHHHGMVVDRWNNTPVSLAEAGSLAQSWIKVIRQGKYIYVLIPEGREPDAEECAVKGAMAVYATARLSFFIIQFVPNTHES
jgi:hypothetical protein